MKESSAEVNPCGGVLFRLSKFNLASLHLINPSSLYRDHCKYSAHLKRIDLPLELICNKNNIDSFHIDSIVIHEFHLILMKSTSMNLNYCSSHQYKHNETMKLEYTERIWNKKQTVAINNITRTYLTKSIPRNNLKGFIFRMFRDMFSKCLRRCIPCPGPIY